MKPSFDTLFEAVLSSIAEGCNRPRSALDAETTTDDLGLDSLVLVAVASEMEMRYAVRLEGEPLLAILDAGTVREIAQVIHDEINAARS